MAKSNLSNYKIIPIFLLLVACSSKTNERDQHEKNSDPNFTLPAMIDSEISVKNLLSFVSSALINRH